MKIFLNFLKYLIFLWGTSPWSPDQTLHFKNLYKKKFGGKLYSIIIIIQVNGGALFMADTSQLFNYSNVTFDSNLAGCKFQFIKNFFSLKKKQ